MIHLNEFFNLLLLISHFLILVYFINFLKFFFVINDNLCITINRKKVAIITTVYGTIEKSLKKTIRQTIPADYFAFVENPNISNQGNWIVDATHYHDLPEYKSKLDDGKMINSFSKNRNPYNIHKYYKMQFHKIPKLKPYRYILWIDSSCQIATPNLIEYLINYLTSNFSITLFPHPERSTIVEEGIIGTKDYRWSNTSLFHIYQPFQDLLAQLKFYKNEGFNEKYFHNISGTSLWHCNFFFVDKENKKIKRFLDEWFLQNLNFTTQDQVSFPFAAWKVGIFPKTLPRSMYQGKLYSKLGHYR